MKLRLYLAGLLCLLAVAGCGGAGGSPPQAAATKPAAARAALKKLPLLFQWVPSANNMPFFLAQSRAYYRDAGLDVEFVDGKGSAITQSADDWRDALQTMHDYYGFSGSLTPGDYFTNGFLAAG